MAVMDTTKFMGFSANMMQDIARSLDGGDANGAMYLITTLFSCSYRYFHHGMISWTVYNDAYQFCIDMMRQLI